MNTITAGQHQTLLDLAIMSCGTLEASMALAKINNISITDAITVGQVFTIPQDFPIDNLVLNQIQENKIVVGTKG